MVETESGFAKFKSAMVKAAMPFIEAAHRDKKQREAFREVLGNILFDTPGPRYLEMDIPATERALYRLFFGLGEIEECVEVLREIPFYMRRFPPKEFKVSRTRFLRYHIGNYLNEVYILRERLKAYHKIVQRVYRRHLQVLERLRPQVQKLEEIVNSFEQIVKVRGVHVHQRRYEDEEVDRLALLEILAEEESVSRVLYPMALRKARRKWVQIMEENLRAVNSVLDVYFEILYSVVFDEKGNWILPY